MNSNHTTVLESVEFRRMSQQKGRIAGTLTALTVVVYFGFMGLLAFCPEVLARPAIGAVNVGIPFGIGVIVWSWLLTGYYVRWANTAYDSSVEELKLKLHLKGDEA